MKSYLTATRLATKLQMLRSGKKVKTLVVVEGVTDARLYGKVLAKEKCELIVGECKQIVVEALKICEEKQLKGIIGIVDADFWHLKCPMLLPANLFLTDEHDLECMLLRSSAYEDVIREYADTNKLLRFEARMKQEVRGLLLENISKVGYLRKMALEEHLEIGFSHLVFEDFVYISDLAIQEGQLLESVLYRCKKQAKYTRKLLEEKLNQTYESADLWQICCGHDLMELLNLGFIHLFGDYNAKKMSSGQLEGSFRLAYQKSYFVTTQLYRSLKQWELMQEIYELFD